MYAIPLAVSGDCLLGRWAYPSSNDLLMSMLINEGVSESLQSYYELVRDNDLSDWAELLLRRKRLLELLVETDSDGTILKWTSWPIVLRQYLYNRSTAGRFG